MSPPTLTRTGVVQSVSGGRALIAVAVQGCAACGQRCGVGRLAEGRAQALLEVPVAVPLAPGETVTFELAEGRLLGAAVMGYLLPACLLILGAGLGEAIGGDAAAALGALSGLAAGIALLRLLRPRLAPVILRSSR